VVKVFYIELCVTAANNYLKCAVDTKKAGYPFADIQPLRCPPIARDLAPKLGMTKEDVKQWLYDNTFWTREEYEWRAWRDRPMPEEIAALPDDALIRVIGSVYNLRGKQ